MEMFINIQAEELVKAIHHLAEAISQNQDTGFGSRVEHTELPGQTSMFEVKKKEPQIDEDKPVKPPVAAPGYTLEQLRAAAAPITSDAQKRPQVKAALEKYSAVSLTEMDPSHYGDFAADLRLLGAQI